MGSERWCLDALPPVNDARNAVMKLSEERFAAWPGLEPPGEKYLVVKELEALRDQAGVLHGRALMLGVENNSSPLSDLVNAWVATLEQLVVSEKALAADFTEATVAANERAWQNEESAYVPLLDYYNANRLRFNVGGE